jgi:hypothetical protein
MQAKNIIVIFLILCLIKATKRRHNGDNNEFFKFGDLQHKRSSSIIKLKNTFRSNARFNILNNFSFIENCKKVKLQYVNVKQEKDIFDSNLSKASNIDFKNNTEINNKNNKLFIINQSSTEHKFVSNIIKKEVLYNSKTDIVSIPDSVKIIKNIKLENDDTIKLNTNFFDNNQQSKYQHSNLEIKTESNIFVIYSQQMMYFL